MMNHDTYFTHPSSAPGSSVRGLLKKKKKKCLSRYIIIQILVKMNILCDGGLPPHLPCEALDSF